jgi:hypothetical protein
VDGCACSFCRNVNERPDFRWIKKHVTVSLDSRLYLA